MGSTDQYGEEPLDPVTSAAPAHDGPSGDAKLTGGNIQDLAEASPAANAYLNSLSKEKKASLLENGQDMDDFLAAVTKYANEHKAEFALSQDVNYADPNSSLYIMADSIYRNDPRNQTMRDAMAQADISEWKNRPEVDDTVEIEGIDAISGLLAANPDTLVLNDNGSITIIGTNGEPNITITEADLPYIANPNLDITSLSDVQRDHIIEAQAAVADLPQALRDDIRAYAAYAVDPAVIDLSAKSLIDEVEHISAPLGGGTVPKDTGVYID